EMCLSVAMDIRSLGENIKKATVQGFYERNIKKKNDYISDRVHKETVSSEIRERNRERKLKRESVIQDGSSDLLHNKETVNIVNDQDPKLSHDTETVNDQDLRLPRGEEVIVNVIDEQVQKGITDSTIDSNLSHDTKTINNVNDDSKLSCNTETINNISQEYKSITNSTENLTLVNEFVQGLLQDFTSHNNQCWESIEITSPTSIPENLQKLAYLFY
ncbi:13449_t:CDS:2, partial [Acaulospora morrowiae]